MLAAGSGFGIPSARLPIRVSKELHRSREENEPYTCQHSNRDFHPHHPKGQKPVADSPVRNDHQDADWRSE